MIIFLKEARNLLANVSHDFKEILKEIKDGNIKNSYLSPFSIKHVWEDFEKAPPYKFIYNVNEGSTSWMLRASGLPTMTIGLTDDECNNKFYKSKLILSCEEAIYLAAWLLMPETPDSSDEINQKNIWLNKVRKLSIMKQEYNQKEFMCNIYGSNGDGNITNNVMIKYGDKVPFPALFDELQSFLYKFQLRDKEEINLNKKIEEVKQSNKISNRVLRNMFGKLILIERNGSLYK